MQDLITWPSGQENPDIGGDAGDQVVHVAGPPEEFRRDCRRVLELDGATYVAGYEVDVEKARSASFDGHPAILIPLSDEMGGREVGQLRLRLDAYHDARLEWTHFFNDPASRAAWERSLETPAGYRRIKARQLEEGMLVHGYEADGPVTKVELMTTEMFGGEDGPFAHVKHGFLIHAEPWADPFDAEEEVLVKA